MIIIIQNKYCGAGLNNSFELTLLASDHGKSRIIYREVRLHYFSALCECNLPQVDIGYFFSQHVMNSLNGIMHF